MTETDYTPEDADYTPKPPTSNMWPWLVFGAGVLLGGASAALALIPDTGAAPVVFGALAAIMAICLTFIIAWRQNAETDDLRSLGRTTLRLNEETKEIGKATRTLGETTNHVLDNIQSVLAEIKEQTAREAYEPISEESDPVETFREEALTIPSYADEAIESLREHRAKLDFDDLRWRRKTPSKPMKGNHGWFVESGSGKRGERWFVRKANGLTVRKAMPREFLDALEKEAQLNPSEIKLDFQLSDHGLAAWYARTYAGALWKVSRSNRNSDAGISVTPVNLDD